MTALSDRFVIRVFRATDGEQPEWVAHVWDKSSGALLPATQFAGLGSTARERLTAFLASEIARETRAAELAAERSARMRKGAGQ
jgi:hypothetical protein